MTNITVTNLYEDSGGLPLSGTVTFTPVATAEDNSNTVLIAEPRSFPVVAGALSATVMTTDTYVTEGAITYRVVEKVGTLYRRKFYVALPSSLGTTVALASLTTYNAPPNTLILEGGEAVDLTTHLLNDHGPINVELADHESRLDSLEAGSAPVIGNHNDLANRNAADAHPQSAITGLVTDLGNKQAGNAKLTQLSALTPANNDAFMYIGGAVVSRTMAQLKTLLALVKGDVGLGNVDNTSDTTKWAATKTLTNTTIAANSGGNNITGLQTDDVTGLDAQLADIPEKDGIVRCVKYTAGAWPLRSTSGTTDPNVPVEWQGGTTAPSISGTGATGAIASSVAGEIKDTWLRESS